MNENKRSENNEEAVLDLSYALRCFRRNLGLILLCASIVCVAAYVLLEFALPDTYTAQVYLAIVPRDNDYSRLSEYNASSAVTRSVNVLNSGALLDQVEKVDESELAQGELVAEQVEETNLIGITVTDASAEGAYCLLQDALEAYPELSGYFESGYLLKQVGQITGENTADGSKRAVLYALVAFVLVVIAGAVICGLASMFTDKIHSVEQAEKALDMELLGVLHFVKKAKDQKAILTYRPDTDIVYAEEMERLVTKVQDRLDSNEKKVLMVSSMCENDGKSTVATNLALDIAGRGQKVLLVDADLRRPAQAKIFDKTVPAGKSFTDYLRGKCDLEEIVESDPEQPKLLHIWQGSAVAEADRLLSDPNFRETIKALRDSKIVDYIIIDTPPVGAVRDAELVAESADSVLLVLRQDMVHAAALNDATDVLAEAGVSVMGGVLNMAYGDEAVSEQTYRHHHHHSHSKSAQ